MARDVQLEVETFVSAHGFVTVAWKSQSSKWSPVIELAVAPTKEPALHVRVALVLMNEMLLIRGWPFVGSTAECP